eukprot:COSAG06_NODE_1429_length_9481_cov_30.750986_5_plen_269_part_00
MAKSSSWRMVLERKANRLEREAISAPKRQSPFFLSFLEQSNAWTTNAVCIRNKMTRTTKSRDKDQNRDKGEVRTRLCARCGARAPRPPLHTEQLPGVEGVGEGGAVAGAPRRFARCYCVFLPRPAAQKAVCSFFRRLLLARRAAIAWRALTRIAGLHPLRISPYARAAGSRDATVFSVTHQYQYQYLFCSICPWRPVQPDWIYFFRPRAPFRGGNAFCSGAPTAPALPPPSLPPACSRSSRQPRARRRACRRSRPLRARPRENRCGRT